MRFLLNCKKTSIFVSGIIYAAARTKEARLRVSVLAPQKLSQLDDLVNALVAIRKTIPFE